LHNDSRKPYGVDSAYKRAAATKLSDPSRFFVLTHAAWDKPDEATDEIDEIEPNSMITIDQEFSVNEDVMEFSYGFLALELMLADPKTGAMRSVQKHQMNMQISGVYTLSPNPSFLLVVNSSTPNHAIHQVIQLLRNRLHTKLDIFNLGLTGSYESPITKRNVLESYVGKSIVIFSNTFVYFSKEYKSPWELLDPWETALLLKGGTNLLFANAGQLQPPALKSLMDWASHATFPAKDFTAGAHSVNDADAKAVALALRKAGPETLTSEPAVHRFPVAMGGMSCFGTLESTVDKSAASAAATLTKNIPLRRFVAVSDPEALDMGAKTGGVIICEGVPRTAKMMAFQGLFPQGTNNMADYDMFFMVSCLPFAVKARMFWNIVGKTNAHGIGCDTLYAGLESFMLAKAGVDPASMLTDEKVQSKISHTRQRNMSANISHRFFKPSVCPCNLISAAKSTASPTPRRVGRIRFRPQRRSRKCRLLRSSSR
jgi:hypothetical protein